MKEQGKYLQGQINEEEIGKSSEKEFRVMIMKKFQNLESRMDFILFNVLMGFRGSSDGKESACNVGGLGLIPESGRSPVEGNGNSLQYSCLENSMDRGTWQAAGYGTAKSQTQLSTAGAGRRFDISWGSDIASLPRQVLF